jgi:hypothetical protein
MKEVGWPVPWRKAGGGDRRARGSASAGGGEPRHRIRPQARHAMCFSARCAATAYDSIPPRQDKVRRICPGQTGQSRPWGQRWTNLRSACGPRFRSSARSGTHPYERARPGKDPRPGSLLYRRRRVAGEASVGRHAFCRTRDMQIVALGNANCRIVKCKLRKPESHSALGEGPPKCKFAFHSVVKCKFTLGCDGIGIVEQPSVGSHLSRRRTAAGEAALPPALVKTHAAPTLLANGPPTMAVLPSAERDTDQPC